MRTPSNLYDLFIAPGRKHSEIARMDLDTLEQEVETWRTLGDTYLTSREIAVLARGWARYIAIEEVVQRFLKKHATYRDLREVIKQ